MRVFKAFFLILNKYKGTVFIFFAVFCAVSLIMAKVNGGGGESSFQQDSLDIAIVDEDDGAMADQIREYFGTHDQVTKMKMDQDKITDALYWRRLDYVLVIPEGAGKTLAQGEIPEFSCMKVPGYFDSAYFEAELQMYLQKMAALIKNGVDTDAAQQQLMRLQQKETKVCMASFVNKNQGDMSTRFFLYVPYLFIAVGISGIGLVLLRINGKEVRENGVWCHANEKAGDGTDGSNTGIWSLPVSVCAGSGSGNIRRKHTDRRKTSMVCGQYFCDAFVWYQPWLFYRHDRKKQRCSKWRGKRNQSGILFSGWSLCPETIFWRWCHEDGKALSDILVCCE